MMARLDYERDYYADLELPANADVAEVKKQFKKLALKWHPDRNPGKEDLAKEKFHVIQAAHEILTDPVTKAKFDAYRQRNAKYPTASGVRGNPWAYTAQEVNQKFGAPPRRPPMPTRPSAPAAGSTRAWDWTQRAKAKTDNAKANMEAWDRSRPQTKPTQPSGTAAAASTNRPGARPANQPPPPPPRTAAQARRQEASFGTRRTGFAPASPVGDEPPVKNHHYNTSTTAKDAGAPHTESKPRPASAFVDPLSEQFSETFLDNRQRTPYAANVGEKTNPFEPLNINRAKSMRDGTRRFQTNAGEGDDAPPPPPPRQRSASVGSDSFKRSTNERPAFSESNAKPTFQSQSKAGAWYSPHSTEPTSAPATATFPSQRSSASSVSSANATVNGDGTTRATNGTKVFSVPLGDDPTSPAQQARFARNSADNINTRFVAEEKGGANFRFSAGAPSSPDDTFLRAKQRARGRQSPLRNEFTTSTESFTGAPQQNEAGKKTGDFVPEQWKEAFTPHIFEPPQPSRPGASPTRPIRPIKKTRPVRKTAGTAGIVEDDETSGEEKPKSSPASSGGGIDGARSPNAMDIDPPAAGSSMPQGTNDDSNANLNPNAPRNINVEPTKPEWRAGSGNVNGVQPPEPKSGGVPVNPNTAGSEDTEEFMRPMFAEFRNVEPFAPPKPTGLGSFADLSSNLPFPSRPSAKIPLAHEQQQKPVKLEIPTPPTAPRPPSCLLVPGTKVSAPAWTAYVAEFEEYMKRWFEFNKKVTDHFYARQKLNERKVDETTKGLPWLNTRGEEGVGEYMRSLEEDKYVRHRWMAACEAHELWFREFLGAREKVVAATAGRG